MSYWALMGISQVSSAVLFITRRCWWVDLRRSAMSENPDVVSSFLSFCSQVCLLSSILRPRTIWRIVDLCGHTDRPALPVNLHRSSRSLPRRRSRFRRTRSRHARTILSQVDYRTTRESISVRKDSLLAQSLFGRVWVTAPLGSTNKDGFLFFLSLRLDSDTTRSISRSVNSRCGRRSSSSISSRLTFRTSTRLSLANTRTSSTSSQRTPQHSLLAERADNWRSEI